LSNKEVPTFERAPFANQVFTDYAKKKFNHFPEHTRKFISELVNHGNVTRAAESAGLKEQYSQVDLTYKHEQPILEAMRDHGVTPSLLVRHLMECLEATEVYLDKKGNPVKKTDLRMKLKALEMILKLRGDFGDVEKVNNTTDVWELFKKDGSKSTKGTDKDSKKGS
jgi:hypothetical protein